MIIYRKANQNDFFAALVLWFKIRDEFIAPDHPDVNPNYADRVKNSFLLKTYINGERVMFIALDDEKIIGAIGVDYNENSIKPPLCVDPEYHRQGIATELLSQVICELKMRGSDIIIINSSLYALPFYENFGFIQTGSERLYNGFVSIPMEYKPKEIWDVLDKDGNKTGRYHERGRKMRTGDYHLCVHVWKHNGRGEWLIDKRTKKSPDDVCGGKWETTGGAAIAGDDSLTAALRESKEELGLDLNPAKGVLFRRFSREGFYGHTYLMDVWVFEHDCAIEDVRFQELETCEVMWANADKIRELIKNNEFFSDVDLYFDEMVDKWGVIE